MTGWMPGRHCWSNTCGWPGSCPPSPSSAPFPVTSNCSASASNYPHIRACTEFALEFNDKYSNADEAQLLQLDEDLNQLGPVLEDRFKQEDRLVKALQVVESLSQQRV